MMRVRNFTGESQNTVATVSNLLATVNVDENQLITIVGDTMAIIPFNMPVSIIGKMVEDVVCIMKGIDLLAPTTLHQYVKL